MRIAIVSDIHGNRTAFEAVLSDLREVSPDVILHGGDLADSGSSPVYVVDQIRDLGWPGVLGNTDEMLLQPRSLEEFASESSAPPALWSAVRELASDTRARLGEARLIWLSTLARTFIQPPFALVHASPEALWRCPGPESSDAELETVYAPLAQSIAVYAHIHRPFIRTLNIGLAVVNTGSVGLSYDGDTRASYLLVDSGSPSIRRVEYDLEREINELSVCGLPHSDWITRMLRSGLPQSP